MESDESSVAELLASSSVLITGGTGSLGQALTRSLLDHPRVSRVAIYSRDELKQFEMRTALGSDPRLRFFLGDVRDLDRLIMAMRGVDYVIHAAALKQVDTAEYNPMEFVKTNILGSENVIQAAISNRVKKVVALSTDKASSPVNLYGATKLTADKLFISSNHYAEAGGTRFSVVRYGNVMSSRGSVIPLFQDLAARGEPLPITDLRMTRFWITLSRASDFVLSSLGDMRGGELYVPKIPSMRLVDLARAISTEAGIIETGIRPGEKLHEEMISIADAPRTYSRTDHYVVAPTLAVWGGFETPTGDPVAGDFHYSSESNTEWLSEGELRRLLNTSPN